MNVLEKQSWQTANLWYIFLVESVGLIGHAAFPLPEMADRMVHTSFVKEQSASEKAPAVAGGWPNGHGAVYRFGLSFLYGTPVGFVLAHMSPPGLGAF
jgi:hypothetical protein